MINKLIKKFYTPYREMWSYLFFGVATTLINFLIYTLLARAFAVDELAANSVAWIFSVTFAFVTNKLVVFRSNTKERSAVIRETVSFFFFRLVSLGIESLIIYLCVTCTNFMHNLFGDGFLSDNNDLIIKLFTNFIVIVLNYIASKLIIFKKKGNA